MTKNQKSKRKTGKTKLHKTIKSRNTLFIRRSSYNTVNQVSGGDTADNYYFSVGFIPNVSELQAMFQKLKLLSVDCEWIPKANTASLSGIVAQSNMLYAFNGTNYDPLYVPTILTINENNKHKSRSITDTFKFRLYPVALNRLGDGSTGTIFYEQRPSKTIMIDPTNGINMPFYGLDWVIPNTGLATGAPLGVWKITYNIVGYLPR